MLLGLCLAMAVGAMIPLRVSGAGNDAAMLKRIASRVDGRMGVIAIEATTPVPCIASQPDPKTFVVELRDVVAVGFQNEFSADPRNPIASVQVEHAAANDGTIVARVRMNLDQPMRPRVPQFAERHLRRGREAAVAATPVATPAAAPAPAGAPAPAAATPAAASAAPVSAPAATPSVEPAVSLRGPSPAIRDVRVQRAR